MERGEDFFDSKFATTAVDDGSATAGEEELEGVAKNDLLGLL